MHLANNIDLQNGLLGGILLGISSSAFMFLTGKVTGMSGICEGTVSVKGESWNFSYIAGLCSAGALLSIYRPESFGDESALSTGTLLVAGLITGFGTRLGGGCTSGHGLCGLSRRSPRSLAAVLTFMTAGAVTAYVSRLPEVAAILKAPTAETIVPIVPGVAAAIGGLYVMLNFSSLTKKIGAILSPPPKTADSHDIADSHMHLASFLSSLLFGLGLGVSGMCNPDRVTGFLDFSGPNGWDPSLAAVMGGGVVVNFLAFHWFKARNTPVALHKSKTLDSVLNMGTVKCNMLIDWKLLVGSALFGMGWGLAGMCPGPAIVVSGAGAAAALKFVPSMVAGMIAKELLMG